jgi:hypothetical protein
MYGMAGAAIDMALLAELEKDWNRSAILPFSCRYLFASPVGIIAISDDRKN